MYRATNNQDAWGPNLHDIDARKASMPLVSSYLRCSNFHLSLPPNWLCCCLELLLLVALSSFKTFSLHVLFMRERPVV